MADKTIAAADVHGALMFGMEEIFAQVHGAVLDKGTSLLETLDTISAAQASQQLSGRCATLAGHVYHLIRYLQITEAFMQGTVEERVDWAATWQVTSVTDDEWDRLRADTRAAYDHARAFVSSFDSFSEDQLGGAMAMIVHTAYHLGEIRQMLCHLETE